MVTFTTNDINSWQACYPPTTYFAPDWSGTAIDALNKTEIPVADRIWCCARIELISARAIRLFAVWCARQLQSDLVDQRSLDSLDAAEEVAEGNIGNSIEIQRLAWLAFEAASSEAEAIASKSAAFTLNTNPKTAAECASYVAANGDITRGNAQIEQLKAMIEAEG